MYSVSESGIWICRCYYCLLTLGIIFQFFDINSQVLNTCDLYNIICAVNERRTADK